MSLLGASMENLRPVAKLAAKALPKAQATTVLALKQMTATEDASLMTQVAELAKWGAQPRLIHELIGVPMGMGLRRMCEKEQGHLSGGRPPESIGALLEDPVKHLQASIFLREFVVQYNLDGRTGLAAEPFLRAYRYFRNLIMGFQSRLSVDVNVDYAMMVCRKYIKGDVLLAHCECGVYFLQNHIAIRVRSGMGCGACPHCYSRRHRVKQLQIVLQETPS
jgi:hypothetical protein